MNNKIWIIVIIVIIIIIIYIVKKTGYVRINVIIKRVRVTTVAVKIPSVSVALPIQHGRRMRHIFIYGLFGSTVFLHIISYTEQFSGKNYWP